MPRALKKKSGLYGYLEATGVLDTGTSLQITEARKKYWRQYKKKWNAEKRKKFMTYHPKFTKEQVTELTKAAKRQGVSNTEYIARTIINSIQSIFVSPDEIQFKTILQQLALNYTALQELLDEERIDPTIGATLLKKITDLERTVTLELQNPKSLDEWIIEAIENDQKYKKHLQQILDTH